VAEWDDQVRVTHGSISIDGEVRVEESIYSATVANAFREILNMYQLRRRRI